MRREPDRRTSLRTRLGAVSIAFLVLVLAAVGLSAIMIRRWDRTLDARGEARAATADVAELALSLSDQETGIRGYLLTADADFLEPYDAGAAVQADIVRRLLAREFDLPEFVVLVDRVVDTGEQWRADVADPVLEDLATAPTDEFAKTRFDEVRAALDGLDAAVVVQVDDLAERARQIQRNVIGVLFLSALVAILGTGLAATLFRRWVLRPLVRISDAARALSHDDTVPLPRFDAPELQDVSDAVGQLQRSLRSARDDAVAALRGIEQSAVLAIQVRSELADEIGEMPDGWAAHTLLVPADGVVAGDCFDVGLLDKAHLYILLIDVTGHGASAALNALKAKSQLRAALRARLSPGSALERLSRETLKDVRADLLTASVIVIDLESGHLSHANAGHPAPMLTDGHRSMVLDGSGPLVGAFAATWSTHAADIPAGWTLLAHTDGLTDTIGAERERFGDERLASCLTTTDPVDLLAQIHDATETFRVGGRSDDLTAIAVRRASVGDHIEIDTTVDLGDGAAPPNATRNGTITP